MNNKLSLEEFKKEIINDYKLAVLSRECSLLGRKEVLMGRGAFGIFGGGKEVPQIAMAKFFKEGDFRSGYYRDQTFMMAIGALTPKQFFASLYGDTEEGHNPESGGRQMNNHFATHSLNKDGSWKNLTKQKNSASDVSSTSGQMPRLLGLAQASKIYKELEKLPKNSYLFSNNGNEIAWGTIGNASTSEGLFWETVNAGGVLQIPMIISIWDDEYGISVHARYQTTKENISEILKGFQRNENTNGYEIIRVKGTDYGELINAYEKAEKFAREKYIPVIVHVTDLMQPIGHSTSGSHERYKSKERLEYEKSIDCNLNFRKWILEKNLAKAEELDKIELEAKNEAKQAKREAWNQYKEPIHTAKKELINLVNEIIPIAKNKENIKLIINNLITNTSIQVRYNLKAAREIYYQIKDENFPQKQKLKIWIENNKQKYQKRYSTHLYSQSKQAGINIKEVKPEYKPDAPEVDARTILRDNFDVLFQRYPELLAFGEDVGLIGDVNQGMEGLQKKYGKTRIFDTGIREATIIGQGIGLAMRGLRPIAEIQYLDYILYALQTISDDLSTLHYRTVGRQKAPLIIRTRGHRLEGIWHSGSPMSGLNSLFKGIYILVPRNMTQAAGFYNTLMENDNPALIIESLNGYRLKEKQPSNFGDFKTPIGKVETLIEGNDITLVSYGSTLRIVTEATKELKKMGIQPEVIDIQTLAPLDIHQDIVKSVKKTNRLMVIDEDVPFGASSSILDEIIEKQDAWKYLDSKPTTLSSKAHRPAYGTDGDYFSKINKEDIIEAVYNILNEAKPQVYKSM